MRTSPNSQQRIAGCTLAALAAVSIILCFVQPGAGTWLPQCPLHEFTGLYCPGCGSTRMLYLLIHGHPLLAFRENALAFMLLPIVLTSLIRQAIGHPALIAPRLPHRLGVAVAAVVLLFTIARNLPFEPFQKLAPQPIHSVYLKPLP
jgi:Protein of unknown function (DUF2752)